MRLLVKISACVGLLTQGALATQPGLYMVGVAPGCSVSTVAALSADGQYAVGCSQTSQRSVAFVWTLEGGRRDVSTGMAAYDRVGYLGIGDDAHIAVGYVQPVATNYTTGFVYAGDPYTVSGSGLPWGQYQYGATGASGNGEVAYGQYDVSTTQTNGFLWFPLSNRLITLDPHGISHGKRVQIGFTCEADAAGTQFAGTISTDLDGSSAVIWDRDGHMFELPHAYPYDTWGGGISRNGKYVVGHHEISGYVPTIWTDRVHVELLSIAGADNVSLLCMADHGRLALAAFNATYSVWTRERGFEPAAQFLAEYGAPVPTGWTVYQMQVLSADGSVMAGTLQALNPVRYQGFVAYTTYQPCYADFNNDGGVDGSDVGDFFTTWVSGVPEADVNNDGGVDGNDVESFFAVWVNGGCVN